MEEMTDVAWNCQVQHILATSASNGYTVVWDLRNKKEILTLSSNQSHSISSIAWHPSVVNVICNYLLV
jgi:protein transport protein SEC31